MLGDPGVGMVGITINSLMINILNASWINIVTPTMTIVGNKFQTGMNNKVGAEIRTGFCNFIWHYNLNFLNWSFLTSCFIPPIT